MKKSKKKEIVKKVKEKLNTKAVIDKNLARALALTLRKESSRFTIGNVFVNAESKEIVATDGCSLLVIKPKLSGLVPSALLNLEAGLYDIVGDILLRKEVEMKDICFPEYQDILAVAVAEQVYEGSILRGLIICMAKNQVAVDVWRYERVLKVLDKYSCNWAISNKDPASFVLMKSSSSNYDVKYIVMSINIG